MVPDGALAEPGVTWLGLVRDEVAAFTSPPFCVPSDALPHTTVGGVVRLFPDPFPIGLAPDTARARRRRGRTCDGRRAPSVRSTQYPFSRP
jgi:hypothetical protein